MAPTHVLRADLATVWSEPTGGKPLRTVAMGHPLDVKATTDKHVEVRLWRYVDTPDGGRPTIGPGYIRLPRGVTAERAITPVDQNRVLRFDFIDVQQGDAAVMETPAGLSVLFDGGESQLFARHLARRYPRTSESKPKSIEAIVVSHGDADHFTGLAIMQETEAKETDWRRLVLQPQRILHNGLVKRPSTRNGKRRPDSQMLGATVTTPAGPVIVGLEEDLLAVPGTEMNRPFQRWRRAIQGWAQRAPVEMRRLAFGVDDAFDFLAPEGIEVEVLGPIETLLEDDRPGLAFFRRPPPRPRIDVDSIAEEAMGPRGSLSASHTINGHSLVLRIRYGNVRFLLSGDLNEEAAELLHDYIPDRLQAEVLKVPHHGSADFSASFIGAVSPVVSVVSSGDESAMKEYIHPRATLMASLGKLSRVTEPVIFVTELAAFYGTVGYVTPEGHLVDGSGQLITDPKARQAFFAFNRLASGAIRVRTDGHRLLVYTDSALAHVKEAYAYEVEADHAVRPVPVLQLR
ncbi:MAG TPA: MBL fold metallo-hydrolase [Candidatus Limnocylindria bacterium]|nr:MBL fold metallo-hydrolase [Candidatus Limnocylindria bacterium]